VESERNSIINAVQDLQGRYEQTNAEHAPVRKNLPRESGEFKVQES